MMSQRPIPESLLARLDNAPGDPERLEEVIRPLLTLLVEITGLESAYFTLVDEAQGVQSVLYARNTRDLCIPEGLSVAWEDTLCRRALNSGRTYTQDVANCWGDSQAAQALGIQTYLSEPVKRIGGQLLGTLCVASKASQHVADEARHYVAIFATFIGKYLESEALLDLLLNENLRLSEQAFTDPLTGIANRRAIDQALATQLAHAEHRHGVLHVAFIDLDGFKEINDEYGHDAGDRFLIQIAMLLSGHCDASDIVGRYGGDEFVVIRPVGADDDLEAQREAFRQHLMHLTCGTFELEGATFEYIGASVGVITTALGETDVQAVLRQSDDAMYRCKQARRE
ncbi:sensor domain-containing diguanylate cyclase [Chromohalobacter sp. HP20-39]|uniref:sensor domain-containing diguanylate cyclase n=1 Tax=Chromohalobacter sp. HP20-39 TaxID=3079306 RepID=UPI00294B5C2B|nr:sensor domain-containing diguanylate cyclase [Chromohalobacter sp. HP20-39]MDV6317564.1 sensor domain-containing diguanylate cyclase [Chromohalobacter sp. HP20-39]